MQGGLEQGDTEMCPGAEFKQMRREWLSVDCKHRLGVNRTGTSVLASVLTPRHQCPAHVSSVLKDHTVFRTSRESALQGWLTVRWNCPVLRNDLGQPERLRPDKGKNSQRC